MATVTLAAGKKPGSTGSKNNKKAWRKTDITDIEDYLADKRTEALKGGPVEAKKDAELFFTDVQTTPLTGRRNKRNKVPRVDEILRGNRLVQAPMFGGAEQPAKLKSKAESVLVAKTASRILRAKDVPRSNVAATIKSGGYDLWSAGPADPAAAERAAKKLEGLLPEYIAPAQKKPVKRPATLDVKPEMALLVPSVIPDGEGASYNPPAKAHEELIEKAVDEEKKRVKKDAKIKLTIDMDKHERTVAAEENRILSSLVDDINKSLNPSTAEDEDDNDDKEDSNAIARNSVQPDRKTKQQRAKEQRVREKARLLAQQKEQRRHDHELNRIKSIKQEINLKAASVEASIAAAKAAPPKMPRLGKYKFVEPAIHFKTHDELPGSLRQLTTESNLLTERYVSLQRRSMIEPRKPVGKSKRPMKRQFTKKNAKEPKA